MVNDPELRLATKADVALVLKLAEKFHLSGPYREVPFDQVSAIQLISTLLDSGVIILFRDQGLIAGTVVQVPCTVAKTATEMAWYVVEETPFRLHALKLLQEAFEYWARNVAEAEFIITGSFHPTSFFTKRGYVPAEQVYLTRL